MVEDIREIKKVGSGFWTSLHALGALIALNSSKNKEKYVIQYKNYIELLKIIIKCDKCNKHYLKILKGRHNLNNYVNKHIEDGMDFSYLKHSYDIHNESTNNKSLSNKLSWADAKKLWIEFIGFSCTDCDKSEDEKSEHSIAEESSESEDDESEQEENEDIEESYIVTKQIQTTRRNTVMKFGIPNSIRFTSITMPDEEKEEKEEDKKEEVEEEEELDLSESSESESEYESESEELSDSEIKPELKELRQKLDKLDTKLVKSYSDARENNGIKNFMKEYFKFIEGINYNKIKFSKESFSSFDKVNINIKLYPEINPDYHKFGLSLYSNQKHQNRLYFTFSEKDKYQKKETNGLTDIKSNNPEFEIYEVINYDPKYREKFLDIITYLIDINTKFLDIQNNTNEAHKRIMTIKHSSSGNNKHSKKNEDSTEVSMK